MPKKKKKLRILGCGIASQFAVNTAHRMTDRNDGAKNTQNTFAHVKQTTWTNEEDAAIYGHETKQPFGTRERILKRR